MDTLSNKSGKVEGEVGSETVQGLAKVGNQLVTNTSKPTPNSTSSKNRGFVEDFETYVDISEMYIESLRRLENINRVIGELFK